MSRAGRSSSRSPNCLAWARKLTRSFFSSIVRASCGRGASTGSRLRDCYAPFSAILRASETVLSSCRRRSLISEAIVIAPEQDLSKWQPAASFPDEPSTGGRPRPSSEGSSRRQPTELLARSGLPPPSRHWLLDQQRRQPQL